jgi:hypothetical protein
VVLKALPDNFEQVAWLTADQKRAMREEMAREERHKPIDSMCGLLSDAHVWLLVAIYFAVMLAVNTLAFWMPSLIHGAGIGSDGRMGAGRRLAGDERAGGRRHGRQRRAADVLATAAGVPRGRRPGRRYRHDQLVR